MVLLIWLWGSRECFFPACRVQNGRSSPSMHLRLLQAKAWLSAALSLKTECLQGVEDGVFKINQFPRMLFTLYADFSCFWSTSPSKDPTFYIQNNTGKTERFRTAFCLTSLPVHTHRRWGMKWAWVRTEELDEICSFIGTFWSRIKESLKHWLIE